MLWVEQLSQSFCINAECATSIKDITWKWSLALEVIKKSFIFIFIFPSSLAVWLQGGNFALLNSWDECVWMCYKRQQISFSHDCFYEFLLSEMMAKLPLIVVPIPFIYFIILAAWLYLYFLHILFYFSKYVSCILYEPFLYYPPIFLISSTCAAQLCLVFPSPPSCIKAGLQRCSDWQRSPTMSVMLSVGLCGLPLGSRVQLVLSSPAFCVSVGLFLTLVVFFKTRTSFDVVVIWVACPCLVRSSVASPSVWLSRSHPPVAAFSESDHPILCASDTAAKLTSAYYFSHKNLENNDFSLVLHIK